MSIIYNWNFNPLESYPTASGQTDVVFNVHWQLYATLESSSYASSIIGTERIPPFQSGSTFIPYNELTKDLVFGWVTASMEYSFSGSVEAKYVSLSQSIYNQINPPVLVQQAPWLSGSV